MVDLCIKMDENHTYPSCIEEEFQITDYDRKEQLRHIRELEEKRNLQEQREIELERIQQQIFNKLKITDKSGSETKRSNTAKSQANPSNKQNETKKDTRTEIQTLPSTAQKNYGKATGHSYKSSASFHSDRNVSNGHIRQKETSYFRDNYSRRHQRIPHRTSRGRPFNYRSYHDKMKNHNRSSVSDSQNNLDSNETQKIDHRQEQMKEYISYEFPPELIPANAKEEEEMLKEAIELSKQQVFIEKVEKKKIEKVIEESEENWNEGRKQQKQFDNRIIHKRSKDISSTSFSMSNHDRCTISSENQKGDNFNRQEKSNTNALFSGSSKILYSNKPHRHELNDDKQNVNIKNNGNTHHRQLSGNRHLHQSYKMYLENCTQIPNSQQQTVTSRLHFAEKSSMQTCFDKTNDDDDTNSSSWKESARKDLKQILHLDDNPDVSVRNVATDTSKSLKTNSSHCDIGDNNNKYETRLCENHFYQRGPSRGRFNTKRSTKCYYDTHQVDDENNYGTHIKCSVCFQNHETCRGENRRGLNKRHMAMQHNTRYNKSNSNNSESVCAYWRPYAKLVEDGKTDSIPPRFRKQYEAV